MPTTSLVLGERVIFGRLPQGIESFGQRIDHARVRAPEGDFEVAEVAGSIEICTSDDGVSVVGDGGFAVEEGLVVSSDVYAAAQELAEYVASQSGMTKPYFSMH